MRMDSETILFIPNTVCKQVGLASCWKSINNLAVFPSQKTISTTTNNDIFKDQSIFILNPICVLHKSIFRKLINESNGIFLHFHDQPNNTRTTRDIQQISRQYRSALRASLEDLEIEHEKSPTVELKELITIFYAIECIWHLCEILYIRTSPDASIVHSILEWVRFHFPKHERHATELLSIDQYSGHLEDNEMYWSTVIGCLLQGRIQLVRMLLKKHSNAENSTFQLADHYFDSLARLLNGLRHNVSTDYIQKYEHWKFDLQSRIEAKQFESSRRINFLMKVIIGDELIWNELDRHCDSWYELFTACLMYGGYNLRPFELGEHANKCIIKMNIQNDLNQLDQILISALKFDLITVLEEAQNLGDNGWFLTHFTDLLITANTEQHQPQNRQLTNILNESNLKKIHENCLLDYGTLMMGHHSLWQLGLSYLDQCKQSGKSVIALLLPRIPLDNEHKTQKIIRECVQRNLTKTIQDVCRNQSVLSKSRGQFGTALMWAIKGRDSLYVTHLAELYLKKYAALESGLLDNYDLFQQLGSHILLSDRLVLLGKYNDFRILINQGKSHIAGQVLLSLMDSKIVPNYFWKVLLTDTVPLLDNDDEKLVFSTKETHKIQQYLHEKEEFIDSKDQVNIIRLATVRNLARALIADQQH